MRGHDVDVDEIVAAVRAAVDDQDRDRLRLLLHPYLHWTDRSGTTIRGRTKVLVMLDGSAATSPPTDVELRDGQIYRWRC